MVNETESCETLPVELTTFQLPSGESATAEKSEAQPGNPSRGYGQLVQPVDISQESESSKGGNFANPE